MYSVNLGWAELPAEPFYDVNRTMSIMGARLFRVKVHTASDRDIIVSLRPNAFVVWVRAEPEHGNANAVVLALLAKHLAIEPKRLRIVKGATRPNKIVAILGS